MLAERDGVAGRDVTPFVLSRVAELTGGKSVDANLALIEGRRLPRLSKVVMKCYLLLCIFIETTL